MPSLDPKTLAACHDVITAAESLEQRLGRPEAFERPQDYTALVREYSRIKPKAELARAILTAIDKEKELLQLLKEKNAEDEWRRMVEEEIAMWRKQRRDAENRFWSATEDTDDDEADRNFLLEIRAGTGGQEAALFAGDLLKMYTRYIEKKGWRWEWMGASVSETGGFKEVVIGVTGRGAYAALRYESGVHRVQRIPVTESSGRMHTSAATVAVLPEPEDVELTIDPKDLKIDVFRSSGPGGQSVNTTDSAVRLTHLPTGLVVVCQDERSQMKNKEKALRVLRARLMERIRVEQNQKQARERRRQVGTGDRSEKIRTYNFPDRRVTDHRVGVTVHRLEDIMEGEMDHILKPLHQAMKAHQNKDVVVP